MEVSRLLRPLVTSPRPLISAAGFKEASGELSDSLVLPLQVHLRLGWGGKISSSDMYVLFAVRSNSTKYTFRKQMYRCGLFWKHRRFLITRGLGFCGFCGTNFGPVLTISEFSVDSIIGYHSMSTCAFLIAANAVHSPVRRWMI
ncbi:hypothetical protein FPQ18DRAFT_51150 [Pyronema domesticum]|nr:hypothetical protein FPQ18DRAFT_51150 [Pyronema domesticum]